MNLGGIFMKLKKIATNYLQYVNVNCKFRTFVLYETLYRKHLMSLFDDKKLNNINESDWQNFFKQKSKTLSNNTLKVLYCLIKNMYRYANIQFDFRIKLSSSKQNTKQIDALTKQEQMLIEKYILTRKDCYKYGIIIALYTGIRIGELLALKWEDVDLSRKTIEITKTVYSISRNKETKIYTETPKTENSNRVISIPKCLIAIFKELKAYQNGKSEFVVSTNKCKQLKVRVYQKSFETLLKKLKLKHHGFHSLRHTFATRAIECGEDVKTLSEILGHSNISITLQSYVHSSLEQKSHLMNKVGKMLVF